MNLNPKLPSALLSTTPFAPDAIWVASTLVLRRNLAKYNFPNKLSAIEASQVLQILNETLSKISSLEKPTIFPINELTAQEKDLLLEHFLFSQNLSDSASAPAFFVDASCKALGLFNYKDHLELHFLSEMNQLEETWNHLAKLEEEIHKSHDLAFSPKFGYLTADPGECGTGLSVCAYLHLPALIHTDQLEQALQNTQEDDLHFMGIAGEEEDLIADLLMIQNNFSLGMSEDAILHAVQIAATKLTGAEKTMRAHLQQEKPIEIKDLISKSFGLLVHSYQLETKEALDLLSVMNFGVSLGFITGISSQKLNQLLFQARRSYLLHLFPEATDPKEIAKQRALHLQKELQGIALSPELH